MTQDSSQPGALNVRLKPVVDGIEGVGKIVLFLVGALYGVGILTQSMYYGKFGIPLQGFIEPSTILAGVWTLVPVAISLILERALWPHGVLHYFFTCASKREGGDKSENVFTALLTYLMLLIGVVSYAFLDALLLPMLGISYATAAWFSMGHLAVAVVASYLLGIIAASHRTRSETIILGPSILALWIGYHLSFAHFVYAEISSQIGGGRPLQVRFVMKDPAHPMIASGDKRLSKTYSLLATDADRYFIWLNDEADEALSIPADAVNGYVVLAHEGLSPVHEKD